MCFSANASFTSAALLTVVGIAALRNAKNPSQKAFGAVPFIFAIQQLSEGFVWLSLTTSIFSGWQNISTYVFLSFAHIVWPVWIPVSILLLEKKRNRKNILYFLSGVGIVMATYYTFCLINYPVDVKIDSYHIQYILPYPSILFTLSSIFYGVATVLPCFISSIKKMKWLGIFITISYIATYIFYREYITSVWCYFAALISITIYWILNSLPHLNAIHPFKALLTNVKE